MQVILLLNSRENFKKQICTRTNKLYEFVSDNSIEEEYVNGKWQDSGLTLSKAVSSHDILSVPRTYAQCNPVSSSSSSDD